MICASWALASRIRNLLRQRSPPWPNGCHGDFLSARCSWATAFTGSRWRQPAPCPPRLRLRKQCVSGANSWRRSAPSSKNIKNDANSRFWPDGPAYYAALLDSFESQPEFRKSVENFSRIYHDRREEKLDPGEYEWRVNRSSHYFLEEFAIFCCLRQRGFRVMVYPGSFSTLAEVAEGGHPGVPAELSDITVVSLHLKGRRG
jgi:hypothetical protein